MDLFLYCYFLGIFKTLFQAHNKHLIIRDLNNVTLRFKLSLPGLQIYMYMWPNQLSIFCNFN